MTRIKYNGKKFKELCREGIDWYEHVRSNGQIILVSMDNKYYCDYE